MLSHRSPRRRCGLGSIFVSLPRQLGTIMKPPKSADDLTLRWWRLTAQAQRNRAQLHRTYRGGLSWRAELRIGFRSRLAVLRGAFVGD
jgi:hypothetical protein